MNIDLSFFNQGWIGTFVGLIGVGFAIYTIVRRTGPRLAFQYFGQRLLEGGGGLLPNEIVVQYAGNTVPRVSLTQIIIWNPGRAPIRGADIVATDPIRFSFDGDGEILKVEIAKFTRNANESKVIVENQERKAFRYQFSFLDRDDGALIRVLHTSTRTRPICSGSIVGLPKGVERFGRIPLRSTRERLRRIRNDTSSPENRITRLVATLLQPSKGVAIAMACIGIVFGSISLQPFSAAISDNPLSTSGRIAVGATGALYLLTGLGSWWLLRRRYPSSLNLDELGADRGDRNPPRDPLEKA